MWEVAGELAGAAAGLVLLGIVYALLATHPGYAAVAIGLGWFLLQRYLTQRAKQQADKR